MAEASVADAEPPTCFKTGLPPLKNDDVTLLHLLAEGMNLLTHPITISFWPRDIARTDQDDIPVETQFDVIVIWITGCVLPERRAFNVHGSIPRVAVTSCDIKL